MNTFVGKISSPLRSLRNTECRRRSVKVVLGRLSSSVFEGGSTDCPNKRFAFKKIQERVPNEGVSSSTIREIVNLRRVDSEHVVQLRDVVYRRGSSGNKCDVVLVFDYFEHDFLGLIRSKMHFELKHIKNIFKQIVLGLCDLKAVGILHRDVKSANILLNNKGEVQLADLGLSISLSPNKKLKKPAATLIYQSPEQLFNIPEGYDYKSDVWSLGCVLAELLLGEPLFYAGRFQHLVELLMQRFGGKLKAWKAAQKSPNFERSKHKLSDGTLEGYLLKKKPGLDPVTVDLLSKLLEVDPEKRIAIEAVPKHPFFFSPPFASKLNE